MSAVADAVTLEVVLHRPAVLPCGCRRQMLQPRGKLRWLRFPNQWGGMAMMNDADAYETVARGWLEMDGIRGRAFFEDDDCPHRVCLDFDGEWSLAHP